jgi:hypothetical protein
VDNAFIFLALILVSGIVLFAVVSGAKPGGGRRGGSGRNHGRSGHSAGPTMSRSDIAARWAVITTMAQTGGGNGLRQAVLEADKLLDQGLRQAGLPGDSMGERLKAARSRFASDRAAYDAIWRAHKLRNALAHEVGFDLVPSQAREALRDFERGLRTLRAL